MNTGYIVWKSIYLESGTDLRIKWEADDEVEIHLYRGEGVEGELLTSKKGASGELAYHIASDDWYTIGIYNPHTRVLGIGSKNVGVFYIEVEGDVYETVNIPQTTTYIRTITITTHTQTTTMKTYTTTTEITTYQSILQYIINKISK